MNPSIFAAMLPGALLFGSGACAQTVTPVSSSVTTPSEVSIPNSRRIEFISRVSGRRYVINVGLPMLPPPSKGYRVLYVLDGNIYFATAVEAVRANGNAPDVMVVGIGYPEDPAFVAQSLALRGPLPASPPGSVARTPVWHARSRERTYDLTLPATEAELAAQTRTGQTSVGTANVGGIDDFLKMIEVDVKPRVAMLGPIDRNHQSLFGHSLGGLAVLRALFTGPSAFRTFIAASPSIWWNNKAILAGESKYAAAVASGQATPRVLITVGADETSRKQPPLIGNAVPVVQSGPDFNMIGNASDLTARLKALRGAPGYEVASLAVFAGQGHGISVWPAMGQAISFAFPPISD